MLNILILYLMKTLKCKRALIITYKLKCLKRFNPLMLIRELIILTFLLIIYLKLNLYNLKSYFILYNINNN
jgi:hypothetical protein